jgi:hypothetical protein
MKKIILALTILLTIVSLPAQACIPGTKTLFEGLLTLRYDQVSFNNGQVMSVESIAENVEQSMVVFAEPLGLITIQIMEINRTSNGNILFTDYVVKTNDYENGFRLLSNPMMDGGMARSLLPGYIGEVIGCGQN